MTDVYNRMEKVIGRDFTHKYSNSAKFFNSEIESNMHFNYFIESRQFIDSNGIKSSREYLIKEISEEFRVSLIIDNLNLYQVLKILRESFNYAGGLVIKDEGISESFFDSFVGVNNIIVEKLFNLENTKGYYNCRKRMFYLYDKNNKIFSRIHCSDDEIYQKNRDYLFNTYITDISS